MDIRNLISRYVAFNHWANERQMKWLKTIDSSILYKETPSSFGSIDRTIQHIVHAQNFWLAIINQGDVSKLDETIKYNSIDVVMSDLLSGSRMMIETFGRYTEQELTSQLQQDDLMQSRYEYMIHVVNHGSFHRGQIVTLARALGVKTEIPFTDYDAFLWVQQYGES